MATNNQGIVHLKMDDGMFPAPLACKRTGAHMAVPAECFDAEPVKCKCCETIWNQMKARAAAKAAWDQNQLRLRNAQ